MTTDLWMLAYLALLGIALQLPISLARMRVEGGIQWSLGNRDTELEVPAWIARANRAQANHLVALAVFAALVLTAHVSGTSNEMTALMATVFFGLRVLYSVVYIAGIPTVRTAVWVVSQLCLVMIFLQLLGAPP